MGAGTTDNCLGGSDQDMVYLHDGTFDGFLTAVYNHYYTEKAEGIGEEGSYQTGLFEEVISLKTNTDQAKKVMRAIEDKLSSESKYHIHRSFLSFREDKDTLLLKYIELAFKDINLDNNHTHEHVLPVHHMSKRVGFETHRFLGLLRFRDVGKVLYADFTPDNRILTLLVDHFADRLKNERFIIHDIKRKEAVVYEKNHWYITDLDIIQTPESSEEEKYYQRLWTHYFDNVAIKERTNKKLQQQFVPKKYRNYITEFHRENQ